MCDASAGCTSGCTAPPASDPTTDDDDDDDDDDGSFGPEDGVPCDYTLTFNNLDDLNAVSDGMRVQCLAAYALNTLITMLDTAYDNYTSVNDGYDQEFDFYVTYIEKLVPRVLDTSFMFDEVKSAGSGFPFPGKGMSCECYTILTVADTPDTDHIHQPDFNCQRGKHGTAKPCDNPPDKDGAYAYTNGPDIYMTLKDKDGYNLALIDAGIVPDWVILGPNTIHRKITKSQDDKPQPSDDKFEYDFIGYPIKNPAGISVPNPKDVVTKGLGSIPELRLSMQATYLEIVLGLYVGGSSMDAAEAYSTPVFMLMQAVDNMAQAKTLGAHEETLEEDEAKRKKSFILLIVSIFLLVYDALIIDCS
jgi:chitinase